MKLYTAPDPDGLMFGLISSAVFMTWQKMVGGRLKSDPSFSITLVWNNFPLPTLTAEQRDSIIRCGATVEETRRKHHGATLARLYDPKRMPQDLLGAHRELDRVTDAVFGLTNQSPSELDRQTALFARYAVLSSGEMR